MRRAFGARLIAPPRGEGVGRSSYIVTCRPRECRRREVAGPVMPAPIMRAFGGAIMLRCLW